MSDVCNFQIMSLKRRDILCLSDAWIVRCLGLQVKEGKTVTKKEAGSLDDFVEQSHPTYFEHQLPNGYLREK